MYDLLLSDVVVNTSIECTDKQSLGDNTIPDICILFL